MSYHCICGQSFGSSMLFSRHKKSCSEFQDHIKIYDRAFFEKNLWPNKLTLEQFKRKFLHPSISRSELDKIVKNLGYDDYEFKMVSKTIYLRDIEKDLTQELYDELMGKRRMSVADVFFYIKEKYTFATVRKYAEKYGYGTLNRSAAASRGHNRSRATCLKKYGVMNPSQSEEIKEKKKETTMKNYGVEHHMQSPEIIQKRDETCLEKYGSKNVSQNQDIKDKKSNTFMNNYGVDNIFKRSDLMKKYWVATLGVDNPKYDSEINKRRALNSVKNQIPSNGFYKYIGPKKFGFLEDEEYRLAKFISLFVDVSKIKVNSDVFEKRLHNKSIAIVPDISVDEKLFFEIKSSLSLSKDAILTILDVANLKSNQAYYFLIYHQARKMFLEFCNGNSYCCHTFEENTSLSLIRMCDKIEKFEIGDINQKIKDVILNRLKS
jgi:hypothetical protein